MLGMEVVIMWIFYYDITSTSSHVNFGPFISAGIILGMILLTVSYYGKENDENR
jgi:hypothetical protein